MKASWMVGRVAVAVAAIGLSACGSITADSDTNRSPPGAMGLNDCATYCGCAQPKSTVDGAGMCSCRSLPDGGYPGTAATCACGGWLQQGAVEQFLLWSAAAECSSFNQ